MIDLVYILGSGSKWHDNEIRYSLRSAEKNMTFRKVHVIGRRPNWLVNVFFTKAEDPYSNKLKNAIHKIRIACQNEEVADVFALMNDDFFMLEPTDKIPFYTHKTLTELYDNHKTKGGYYYNAIGETIALLQDAGLKDLNFEIHAPILINKKEFLAVTDALEWESNGLLFRSIYGNTMKKNPTELPDDCKIYSPAKIKGTVSKFPFISICDQVAVHKNFHDFINRKFPSPSKFESVL